MRETQIWMWKVYNVQNLDSDLQNAINVYMEYYDYSKTNVKFIP